MADDHERSCLWCGDTSKSLTLEHIVPKWLPEFLEGSGSLVHTYTEPDKDEPARSWTAMDPSFTAKIVCGDCNHGWMSQLETLAKDKLPPMFAGRRTRLTDERQMVLARWGAKTALMFQAAESPERRVVPPERFGELMNARRLPAKLRVWVGSVAAHGAWSASYAGDIAFGRRRTAFYSILLTFDQLAFMVIGADNSLALRSLELGPLGAGWREVCPGRRDYWPPPYTFPAEQFPGMPQMLEHVARAPHPLFRRP